MDIQYLLFLQGIRNSLPHAAEKLAVLISDAGASVVTLVVCCLVYWCLNKEEGVLFFTALFPAHFVNNLIKQTLCIYRPWIRDARVIPAEGAISGAGGYSFPSGHTVAASSTFGTGAWLWRKRKRIVSILFGLLIMLIMFSRNFLGVHTPQDVLVGMLEGFVMIFLAQCFGRWSARHPEKDLKVLLICLAVTAAAVLYLALKPYPMDYQDGVLLVDPFDMMKDGMKSSGAFAGLACGWYLERRLIRFTTDCGKNEKIMRLTTGLAVLLAGQVIIKKGFYALAGELAGGFLYGFCGILLAVFLIPLMHDAIRKKWFSK